jgi:hypothetical protein
VGAQRRRQSFLSAPQARLRSSGRNPVSCVFVVFVVFVAFVFFVL